MVLATPTGGRPVPAMRLPIFLLKKSFSEIQKEAANEEPPPDMEAFIESLDVSPELRDWMKKKKTVSFAGHGFTKQLSVDDVCNIPEFWEAYLTRNGQDVTVGFPRTKFRETIRGNNPAKYDEERKVFKERVRKFLESYPHTKEGMELHLTNIDPGQRWARKEMDHRTSVHQRGLQLAQTRYLVAKSETDLQGRCGFVRVTPGDFWLTTLEYEAVAGDVRLRWDFPVQVRPNTSAQVELSNVNALPRVRR